ncbi:quinone oxidoreductase [Niallia circulans]|uniref:Quinone oxidoreductase n=1 Tax=Niallia circulans TaxID=1397 RepID=A0A553SID3_NIACI|nr:quinone oxidoreductase [Niallia circulans]TRZ36746.1 quinone oxidoreductase [Niallia circulans]
MKALCFMQFGPKEVLKLMEVPDPIVQEHEIIVRTKAIGVNYADIYRRKGNYHLEGEPPYILGYEGAGVVEAVGAGVKDISVGDRIAFADVPYANAELVAVPADKAIPVPADITFEEAAAVLLQGLTAQYLSADSFTVKQGDFVVVHSAAGGVGQLLVQLAKLKGAVVIAIASTSEKAAAAKAAGADHTLTYEGDWIAAVKKLTEKTGADVVYDAVGATLMQSFEAAKTGGTVVFYGMAGGDPPLIDPRMLMDTSKTLTGGDLWNVLQTRADRISRSGELFQLMAANRLLLPHITTFPLSEGQAAHGLLESRQNIGKIILLP